MGYEAVDQSVAAFSLRDGRPLWDNVLTLYHPRTFESGGRSEAGLGPYVSSLAIDRDLFGFWADDGDQTQVYGVDEYVVAEQDGDVTTLVAMRAADPAARRVILQPFHPVGYPGLWTRVRRCGWYRDRLVFLLQANLDGRNDDRVFVVITDRGGYMLRAIDLGNDMIFEPLGAASKTDPDTAPLSGEQPRFVPYVQASYGKADA